MTKRSGKDDLTSLKDLFVDLGLPPEQVKSDTIATKLPTKAAAKKPAKPALDLTPIPAGAFDDVIRPEDVGYTHPVLLQCFLPVRHSKLNAQRWQTDCGRASLVVRAGELVKPGDIHKFKQCSVPAGPKARIVSAYINDYIYRKETPIVPLGDSMRQAMEKMGIPIGGPNGDELTRELENFAAAEIMLGVWDQDGSAHQESAKVSRTMSFWVEKNPDQKTFWQPEMTVSTDYFKAITEREMTPFHWPALIGLAHNARAMDIHCFLTYRLHKGLAKPVTLSRPILHAMFGRGVKNEYQFWPEFKAALAEAHKQYRTARIEIARARNGIETGITLKNSPPLIPHRKLARIKRIGG